MSVHLSFNTTQCELLTDYTMCISAPRCFSCVFHRDFADDLAWMLRPLAASSRLYPVALSNSSLFSCLYGDATSVCDALRQDVMTELRNMEFVLNWDELRSPATLSCIGIICIMCFIVICDMFRIRKQKQFYSEI